MSAHQSILYLISQCQRRSLPCHYPTESRRGMRKKKAAEGSKDVIDQSLPGEAVLTPWLSFRWFVLSLFAIISGIPVGTCAAAFQVCFPVWQLDPYVAVRISTCHVVHTRSLSCNFDSIICTCQSKWIASVINTIESIPLGSGRYTAQPKQGLIAPPIYLQASWSYKISSRWISYLKLHRKVTYPFNFYLFKYYPSSKHKNEQFY